MSPTLRKRLIRWTLAIGIVAMTITAVCVYVYVCRAFDRDCCHTIA